MNFKTTFVLIVLLAVAAVALYFTRDRGDTEVAGTTAGDGRKLLEVKRENVTKVTIAPAIGETFTLEKSGADWLLTEPVSAPAETFEVDSLLRAIADAASRGALEGDDATSSATGLSTPNYRVTLVADGETHTLNVGAKSAVGGNVYVSVGEGGDSVHVTDVSLTDQLEKPASEYRQTQLVEVPSNQVQQITVTNETGQVDLRAQKQGDDWQIVEPAKMPAEKSEIDDLIFAATGLRAAEFVSENPADAPKYQLDKPRLTVTLSTDAPATQPATAPATQDAGTTIKFGRHDDVRKQNVYATVSGSPSIAKVAATVLDTFDVKPLDLRDRRVVDVDPKQVSRLSFTADLAATTQPTTQPASKREVVLQRRIEAAPLGPAAPTTAPTTTTTAPATTAEAATEAATQPTQDLSQWELVSDPGGEASDAKVDAILNALHPLRAENYLEAVPTTQAEPLGTYTINVTTEGPGGASPQQHQIRLTDRGDGQPLIGEYNGLVFELDRSILRQLKGEFTKGSAPAAPAPPAGGNEPNLPFPIGQ